MAKRRAFQFGGGGGSTELSLVHPEAVIDMDFARGKYFGATPSQLVVSRAMSALALNGGGSYSTFPINTARITNLGLLVEEARTNLVTNSAGNGFVVGTVNGAGNVGTGWTGFTTAPCSIDVVSQETRNGITGLVLRFYGTPTATSAILLGMSPSGNYGTTGETYTNSVFVQVVSGPLGTATGWQLRDSNGASPTLFTPDTTFQRISNTRTQTANNQARPTLRFNFSDTVTPVDFTLFIGGAQSSLAGFSLSPITTTGTSLTRPADNIYLPISGIGTEYTIYAEGGIVPIGTTPSLAEMWASVNDRASARVSPTEGRALVVSAGVVQTIGSFPSIGAGRKCAVRIQNNNIIICADGTLGTNGTSASAPTVAPTQVYIGCANGTSQYLNQFLRRIAIIPRALSDAELQAITGA